MAKNLMKIDSWYKELVFEDEKLFKLRKRIARAEKNILGYTMEIDDNGKER